MPNGPTPERIPDPIGDPLPDHPVSDPSPLGDPPVVPPGKAPWPEKILESKNGADGTAHRLD